MSDFDRIYREGRECFGSEPSALVKKFINELPPESRVLVLGIGHGRNVLGLARRGVQVTGVDSGITAIRDLEVKAHRDNVPLTLWHGDFIDFDPATLPHGSERFDVIMAFGLLQLLSRPRCASLLHRFRRWTRLGGTLLISARHVEDPAYEEISRGWQKVGLHSFRGSGGQIRTFLGRNEILDLLLGWSITHHFEGVGPDHRHGDDDSEHHGVVEVIAVRTA